MSLTQQASSKENLPKGFQRIKNAIDTLSTKAPCAACAPSLFFAPGTDDDLRIRIGGAENGQDYNKAYVFVVVCLGTSQHEWELSDDKKQGLVKQIELNGGETARADGRLTLAELLDFVDDPDSCEIIKALPGAVHGLLVKELVKEAFGKHDVDGSGYLDLTEFSSFIDVLEELHFQYLLASAFQKFRAFFGRGQAQKIKRLMEGIQPSTNHLPHRPEFEGSTFELGTDPDCNSILEIPPGWWQDFVYYSANNHPLHGIFACDPRHPFSWLERLAVELATIVFSFLTTYQEVNIIVVTIVGTIMWNVLFLCFTSPCLQADAADISPEVYRRNEKISRMISYCAYLVVLIGVIVVISYGADQIPSHALRVIQGRFYGYLFFWVAAFLIYFNLFIAWGQHDPHGGFSLGNLVGLGQWRIEKQRFRALFTHRLLKSMSCVAADTDGEESDISVSMDDCGPAKTFLREPPQNCTADAQLFTAEEVHVQVSKIPEAPSAEIDTSELPPACPFLDAPHPRASPRSLVWLESSPSAIDEANKDATVLMPPTNYFAHQQTTASWIDTAQFVSGACTSHIACSDPNHAVDVDGDETWSGPLPKSQDGNSSAMVSGRAISPKRGLNKIPSIYI